MSYSMGMYSTVDAGMAAVEKKKRENLLHNSISRNINLHKLF